MAGPQSSGSAGPKRARRSPSTRRPKTEAKAEPRSPGKHLLFHSDEAELALPIEDVRRVIGYQTPRPLPGSRPELQGVVSLADGLHRVYDLGLLLYKRPTVQPSRILVVEAAGQRFGLAISATGAVVELDPAAAEIRVAFGSVLDHDGEPLLLLDLAACLNALA